MKGQRCIPARHAPFLEGEDEAGGEFAEVGCQALNRGLGWGEASVEEVSLDAPGDPRREGGVESAAGFISCCVVGYQSVADGVVVEAGKSAESVHEGCFASELVAVPGAAQKEERVLRLVVVGAVLAYHFNVGGEIVIGVDGQAGVQAVEAAAVYRGLCGAIEGGGEVGVADVEFANGISGLLLPGRRGLVVSASKGRRVSRERRSDMAISYRCLMLPGQVSRVTGWVLGYSPE
jgi:hypothetical protein